MSLIYPYITHCQVWKTKNESDRKKEREGGGREERERERKPNTYVLPVLNDFQRYLRACTTLLCHVVAGYNASINLVSQTE